MKCELVAARLRHLSADGFPTADEWARADTASFWTDWQGKNEDPERRTDVCVMWAPDSIYLRFVCRYRELVTFDDSDPNGRRDGLWDRDVAEAFLQPDSFGSRHYKEIEVAPNGMWVDLDIFAGGRRPLESGMRNMTTVVEDAQLWVAQIVLPMNAITQNFSPRHPWRANFYRCEGRDQNRWYSAWQPTLTPQPAFHVPEKFGVLQFE